LNFSIFNNIDEFNQPIRLNPVDVSLAAHFDLDIFFQTTRTVAADPAVDAIIVIGCGLTPEMNQIYRYFEKVH
jgi:hypothetical protein